MIRVRHGADGTCWLPRADKETEAWLDSQYVRLPGQLKWRSKLPNMLNFFLDCHINKSCAIIGKGPSMDLLNFELLQEHGFIIAINEALLKIESLNLDIPLYGTQLDFGLGESCRPTKATTKLFCGPRCANLYENETTKLMVDPAYFGLNDSSISAVFAVALARHMGANRLELFGFDGCLKDNYEYAKSIGYSSVKGGSPLRFAAHRQLIEHAAKNIPLDWVQIKGNRKYVVSKLV